MLPLDVTDDAFLGGKLKLLQPRHGHRAGHDAILLAAAAPVSKLAIDLGAGIGIAGFSLLARHMAEYITLVEIDPELAELSRVNACRNGFDGRTEVIAADVTKLARFREPAVPKPSSADLVLMNPPFNDPARRNASPNASRRRAHTAKDTDLNQWVAAADRLLSPGGTVVLIHRPEAIEMILSTLKGRFGAIELIPIFSQPDAPAIRIIVRAIKGRRTAPALQKGIVLRDASGQPTAAADAILRDGTLLNTA
jgi:tRNA1(Val) A37 N6-methylase TrmN6